ncbi:hypothetical protein HERIO_1842 [Hepatospora eriocheir]|uniref:Uncharacterized protein n=1 Tax=Hepatospora eriocheir TaxID=1081669 RepID=A0A1X0Q944_9MICR|nr:hypothetical protein HERIO_1842 [Hepatospora eriocheir]
MENSKEREILVINNENDIDQVELDEVVEYLNEREEKDNGNSELNIYLLLLFSIIALSVSIALILYSNDSNEKKKSADYNRLLEKTDKSISVNDYQICLGRIKKVKTMNEMLNEKNFNFNQIKEPYNEFIILLDKLENYDNHNNDLLHNAVINKEVLITFIKDVLFSDKLAIFTEIHYHYHKFKQNGSNITHGQLSDDINNCIKNSSNHEHHLVLFYQIKHILNFIGLNYEKFTSGDSGKQAYIEKYFNDSNKEYDHIKKLKDYWFDLFPLTDTMIKERAFYPDFVPDKPFVFPIDLNFINNYFHQDIKKFFIRNLIKISKHTISTISDFLNESKSNYIEDNKKLNIFQSMVKYINSFGIIQRFKKVWSGNTYKPIIIKTEIDTCASFMVQILYYIHLIENKDNNNSDFNRILNEIEELLNDTQNTDLLNYIKKLLEKIETINSLFEILTRKYQ